MENKNLQSNDDKIFKETSGESGPLILLIIVVPIIFVILLAIDIPIPSPRFLFWVVAVVAILLIWLTNMIDLLFQIVLPDQYIEKYNYFKKSYCGIFACFKLPEINNKKPTKIQAVFVFVLLTALLVFASYILYFITFGK